MRKTLFFLTLMGCLTAFVPGASQETLSAPVSHAVPTAERRLIPGGQNVGVALNCAGVVVAGTSDPAGARSPARLAGIRPGDIITQADGEPVCSAEQFSKMIAADRPVRLTILRGGRERTVSLTPVKDAAHDEWHIGAWVRDSAAGIGTLTFIDPETGSFGALGHAIQDADTFITLPVQEGGIFESRVTGILPGRSGTPGEILGTFPEQSARLGEITSNTPYGIFGECSPSAASDGSIPVGDRHSVHTGAVQILTTLEDGAVHAYDAEIVRLYPQEAPAIRSMVVRITDPALLEKTGGIVQGMSGSPILQDGKLIGAVTHVFLNDPTMGYGVYIDWMLNELESIAEPAAA